MSKADGFYLEARDAALAAISNLNGKRRHFRTPDGTRLRVNRKPPLRLYLAIVSRQRPGEDGWTSFSFQRNGRVNLGDNRRVPLREAIAAGHEPWASREEVFELAREIESCGTAP